MAVTNFIPQVWSARLLAHLDKAHVLTNLVNRDYEGEIRQYGDTVKITQIGDITIKDYVTNTDIDDPQELTTEQQLLVIDQQKYYAFQIDDVDAAQARASLADAAMQRAAYGLADVADRWLASLMAAGADEGNQLGSDAAPVALTADTAYTYLLRTVSPAAARCSGLRYSCGVSSASRSAGADPPWAAQGDPGQAQRAHGRALGPRLARVPRPAPAGRPLRRHGRHRGRGGAGQRLHRLRGRLPRLPVQ